MATLIPSAIFNGLRGKIGDLVFRRYRGKLIVQRAPNFKNRVWSPAQRAQQKRFRKAVKYANEVFADKKKRAKYAHRAVGKSLFHVVLQEHLRELVSKPKNKRRTPNSAR